MYYLAVAQYRISFQVTICVFMNYKNDITKVVMKRNMCQHNLDKHKTYLNTNTCIGSSHAFARSPSNDGPAPRLPCNQPCAQEQRCHQCRHRHNLSLLKIVSLDLTGLSPVDTSSPQLQNQPDELVLILLLFQSACLQFEPFQEDFTFYQHRCKMSGIICFELQSN